MKLNTAALALPLLASSCLAKAVEVDIPTPHLAKRDVPEYESIDADKIKEIIDGPHEKPDLAAGETAKVYFCQGENWEPPCYVYDPDLNYVCEELTPNLSGQLGSIFVDQGIICRLAIAVGDECRPYFFFAWPEIQGGWDNLTSWNIPADLDVDGEKTVGGLATHFTCARCDNCPPGES